MEKYLLINLRKLTVVQHNGFLNRLNYLLRRVQKLYKTIKTFIWFFRTLKINTSWVNHWATSLPVTRNEIIVIFWKTKINKKLLLNVLTDT